MDKNTNNNFENALRQKFDAYRVEPPATVLANIHTSYKHALRKRKLMKGLYSSVAVLAVLSTLFGLYYFSDSDQSSVIGHTGKVVEAPTVNSKNNSPTEKTHSTSPQQQDKVASKPSLVSEQRLILIDSVICGLSTCIQMEDESAVLVLPEGVSKDDNKPQSISVDRGGTYMFEQHYKKNHVSYIARYSYTFVDVPENELPERMEVCGREKVLNLEKRGSGFWNESKGVVFSSKTELACKVTASDFGLYRLVWNENTEGCHTSDTIMITFNPRPEAHISISGNSFCEGELVLISAIPDGHQSFKWNFGKLDVVQSGEHQYWIKCPGDPSKIQLTVSDEKGCSSVVSRKIPSSKAPVANFEFMLSENTLPSQVYFTNTSESNNQLHARWDFGDGDLSDEFHPEHFYSSLPNRPVSLIVTDEFGCEDSVALSLPIKNVSAPEKNIIFTPNGDGLNDFFEPNTTSLEKFTLFIFDHSGKRVFESSLSGVKWDGNLSTGNKANEGLYFYLIKGQDSLGNYHEFNGSVYLVRN